MLSFPVGTEMFQFSTFASYTYAFSARYPCGWVAPFGNPKIAALLPAPLGLSQVHASFIASRRQDIRHAPLCLITNLTPRPASAAPAFAWATSAAVIASRTRKVRFSPSALATRKEPEKPTVLNTCRIHTWRCEKRLCPPCPRLLPCGLPRELVGPRFSQLSLTSLLDVFRLPAASWCPAMPPSPEGHADNPVHFILRRGDRLSVSGCQRSCQARAKPLTGSQIRFGLGPPLG